MSTQVGKLFLTKGVGVHAEKLVSFEMALRDARVAQFNIVRVSSILPPAARVVSCERGVAALAPGEVVFAVVAESSTDEPYRRLTASIGIAVPRDNARHGYLAEHHSFGQTGKQAGDYAEDLAAQMLATTMGLRFNADSSWNERKEHFKVGGHIIRTSNITQSATGDRNGKWTTVVAAAVLF